MTYKTVLDKIIVEQPKTAKEIILTNTLEIPNPKKVSDNQESSSISFGIGIAILMVILIY